MLEAVNETALVGNLLKHRAEIGVVELFAFPLSWGWILNQAGDTEIVSK